MKNENTISSFTSMDEVVSHMTMAEISGRDEEKSRRSRRFNNKRRFDKDEDDSWN